MTIKTLDNAFDKKVYNSAAKHPLQSWEWGEARSEMGIDVLRVGVFEGDELQDVFQCTFHALPYTSLTVGYLPKSSMPTEQVLNYLREEGKKRNALFIKIEPDVQKKKFKETVPSTLRESPHPLFPKWTQVLDISKSEKDLLTEMKSKTRYNIRLAERKGVKVDEVTNDEGFQQFSKLYFETTARQKYHGHTPGYHKIVFSHLKDGISHILLASYKDEPLAAYHLFHWNDTLYYPYGGSSDKHRNLMATNLIMWEAIRLGKRLGANKFDMWGSLPQNYDRSKPWSGFTRFKEGYGTEFVEFIGSYDLVINSPLYSLFNIILSIRKKVI